MKRLALIALLLTAWVMPADAFDPYPGPGAAPSAKDCLQEWNASERPQETITLSKLDNFLFRFNKWPEEIRLNFRGRTISLEKWGKEYFNKVKWVGGKMQVTPGKQPPLLAILIIHDFTDLSRDPDPNYSHFKLKVWGCGATEDSPLQSKTIYHLEVLADQKREYQQYDDSPVMLIKNKAGKILKKYGTFPNDDLYKHCRRYC